MQLDVPCYSAQSAWDRYSHKTFEYDFHNCTSMFFNRDVLFIDALFSLVGCRVRVEKSFSKVILPYDQNNTVLGLLVLTDFTLPTNLCWTVRKVWRYQRGDQKPEVKEGQTIQRPKEKGQTMTYKTLHRKPKIEQHERH